MNNNKLLFINYIGPGPDIYHLYPDNGLALLASILINEGYKTKIIDFCTVSAYKTFFSGNRDNIELAREINKNLNPLDINGRQKFKQHLKAMMMLAEENISENIFKEIEAFRPGYIGFKLWSGFGTSGSIRLALKIKQRYPNITIIAGGPQTESFREDIINAGQFDYVIYGEGELSLPQLLNSIKKNGKGLDKISTLIYRDGARTITNPRGDFIDISKLPAPCYDIETYPAMENDKIKIFILEESRGCPNSCHFCIHPKKSGQKYRIRDIDAVAKELEYTSNQLKSKFFRIAGSNPPPANIMKLADRIKDDGYTYSLFGYANTKVDFKLLKESGCCAILFGVESGSTKILENMMGKKILPAKMLATIEKAANAGIAALATVIIPTPLDTPETIEETINFLMESKLYAASPQLPYLEPETTWWDKAEDLGFKFGNKDFLRRKLLTYDVNAAMEEIAEHLPYQIKNFTQSQSVEIRKNIIGKMAEKGINYGLVDYMYLCSKAANKDPVEFMNLVNKILFEKDAEQLEELVKNINKNLELDYNKKTKI